MRRVQPIAKPSSQRDDIQKHIMILNAKILSTYILKNVDRFQLTARKNYSGHLLAEMDQNFPKGNDFGALFNGGGVPFQNSSHAGG